MFGKYRILFVAVVLLGLLLGFALGFFVWGKKEPAVNVSELIDRDSPIDFQPANGMPITNLTEMPGVSWHFERSRGVCAPDTSVLWIRYEDRDYLTNVFGVDGRYSRVTTAGRKYLSPMPPKLDFQRVHFTPQAILYVIPDLTLERYREMTDTVFAKTQEQLKQVVLDFARSGGNIKYMASGLASNWDVVLKQSAAEGSPAPNPFNHTPYIQFRDKDINVEVSNPSTGEVELSAFCYDNVTLGHPGWAYWTIGMCKEDGEFKVKTMPVQHRKFTN